MVKRFYGWVPQKPDQRDRLFTPKPIGLLPPSVDLRPLCPPVYDQGQLGSCTANGIAFAYEFAREQQKLTDFMPSRLFIYYNERVIEHSVKSDAGANIRDGFKTMNKQGVCPETDWPYLIDKFTQKPPKFCYSEAQKDMVLQYGTVAQQMNIIKSSLAETIPVVIGISVYESFESDAVAKTGIVPLPDYRETLLGGHCTAVVGYDDSHSWWIVRNSWGSGWGDKGYFYLPYSYLTNENLSSDFWNIKLVA